VSVDRKLFTPDGTDPDYPVLIREGCTVPTSGMAYMLADALGTGTSVLEIGTGSGFQTAVLADRFVDVVSVEMQPVPGVQEKLPASVTLIVAGGCTYDSGEQFDGVVVTFAAREIAPAWIKQLRDGGRMVVPLQIGNSCRISVYVKIGARLHLDAVLGYALFTPQINPTQ
jgi:protein-L-isoaspartate(D-aspartate) O-methyltransferase